MKAVALLVTGYLVSTSHAASASLGALQGTEVGQRALQANAKLREELLSKAVRVDEDSRGLSFLSGERQLQDEDFAKAWVSGYSLKFQGCHHISQWNDEADNEDDVRIATKRLVRFRMCPTQSCNSANTVGCTEGYGDYIVDLNTYLYYYFNAKSTYQMYECNYLANYVCGCNDNNGNQDYCLWDCFSDHNMASVCMQNNPYNADNGNNGQAENNGNGFDLQDYMECTESNVQDENGNALYIGPFCASQGGTIHLGIFTDDSCTNFADSEDGRSAYLTATGYELPYAEANIVDLDCMSCIEPSEKNNAGNDAEDGDNVNEMCEKIYTLAGKCEASLPYGTTNYPNNNACNYLEGIKIVRADGTIVTADSRANKAAAVFIGLFTTAFVLLSAYVYFLKTKLDRASINISE
jgi:hypothetical protein